MCEQTGRYTTKMKIKCSREQLNEIVNIVQKAIPSKAVMPILECIKLEALGDGHIIMTGNNLDMCIVHKSECNVIEGGSVALMSKMFGEIVRKMPDGEVDITVNEENNITKIKCGVSEFNIQGMGPNEYPDAPKINEIYKFSLSQKDLRKIIRKTVSFTAANEGKKPVFTGALFDIKNNILNVAATDGHRLAVVKEELEGEGDNIKFVVPGQTLREIFKILHDEDSMVDIIVSDRHALFDFGDFQVYTRLLEGDFLRYDAIISAVNTINLTVNKRVLMDSLERAMLLINDDTSSSSDTKVPVRFNISYGKIDISCITGKGQVNDTVEADIDGGDLIIGFNCRFLLDAMNVCEEDVIKMEFSAPTSGCFIKSSKDDDSYVYMVLPVRLYN